MKTKIKERRVDLGMNQEELAYKLGITQASVSQIERGERFPSMDLVNKLEVVLRKSRHDLLICGVKETSIDLSGLEPKEVYKIKEYIEFLKYKKRLQDAHCEEA